MNNEKVLREKGQFELIEDTSTNVPTYFIRNTILVALTKGKGVSYNFDKEKKTDIMRMSDREFITACKQRAGNDIICKEVAESLWGLLGDIPCDEEDDQNIDEVFDTTLGVVFEKGTDKQEIWHWFESFFNLSVAEDLMYVN